MAITTFASEVFLVVFQKSLVPSPGDKSCPAAGHEY